MNTSTIRSINKKEKEILKKMLSLEFRGGAKLLAQLDELYIFQKDETLFGLCKNNSAFLTKKPKTFGLPVQAFYSDKDGVRVYIDLFVDESDNLCELEIWKADGSPVLAPFTEVDELTIQFLSLNKPM